MTLGEGEGTSQVEPEETELTEEETKKEWDPSQVDPSKIKVLRPGRWKRSGSASLVHHRKVSGDLRDEGAGVGGSINTDHQGSNEKRPTETKVERHT